MDLSLESCKYRLCQLEIKTVKIFENVAFSGSHSLKAYIYCKLETYLFLTLSLLVIGIYVYKMKSTFSNILC